MLKVLGRLSSINVRKVVWALDEVGLDYLREDWGGETRSTKEAAYLALNPKALVPVLIDGDSVLTESNTIMRYVVAKAGRDDLLPTGLLARAKVEEWIDWAATDLNSAARYAFLGLARKNPAYQDAGQQANSIRDWTAQMMMLEARLAAHPFVAGEAFTLADIPVGLFANRWLHSPFEKPALVAVTAYAEKLAARPAAAPCFGAAMV